LTPVTTLQPSAPPEARRSTDRLVRPGWSRPDPYAWLHDTSSTEVTEHLLAERSWYDTSVSHVHSLTEELRSAMVRCLPDAERSPMWSRRRFSYYKDTPVGKEYPRICRRNRDNSGFDATDRVVRGHHDHGFSTSDDLADEVLLDASDLLGPEGYLELGVTLVSPDEDLLAYSVDTTGDEVYRLRLRDLTTGRDLPEEMPRTYYGGAWSADSAWFFYTVHDGAYRPFQVWRHRVGTTAEEDVLVLEEPDGRFELRLRGTRSGDWVVAWAESSTTSECWVVDARDPASAPRSTGGRRDGVKYRVEHRRGPGVADLLVVTDDRTEGRLMTAPLPGPEGQDWSAWSQARAEDPAVHLRQADSFAAGVVLSVRTGGDHALWVLPHDDLAGAPRVIASLAPGGGVHLARSTDPDAGWATVKDESWLSPPAWSRVDLTTGERVVVHRGEAPGHDPGAYVVERRTFPSADGTLVPASLLRHRDTALDGSAPALLWAYGAYGYTFEPEWDPGLPALLDRGVVWVHAHVRGGSEQGRAWYLDGKMGRKQHTFDDLVAVADGLAAGGLVDPDRIATRGLSAGGLLQGAVLSQRPDRWRAVVAEVPFVDVVTTMFDETTPLTITEWEEWGDPRIPEQLAWMAAYSPYENIPPAGGRPDLLVTGAVHDPRVMVREPAKWVAALRHSDPEWSPRCLFRCEVGAGAHSGPSGRYGHLAYEAEVYAWVLDRVGQRS
jgi:oligopeptidase B